MHLFYKKRHTEFSDVSWICTKHLNVTEPVLQNTLSDEKILIAKVHLYLCYLLKGFIELFDGNIKEMQISSIVALEFSGIMIKTRENLLLNLLLIF